MTKERLGSSTGKRIGPTHLADKPPSRSVFQRSPRGSSVITGAGKEIQKIFQAMNRGLIITDPQGRITQANPVAETLTGLKRTEILGKILSDLPWQITCPNGLPIPLERMPDNRALKEKRIIRDAVFGVKRPDGSTAWLSITAAPLTDEDKEVEAVIITMGDITRMRQAEEALQNRNAVLEAVSFAAKQFLLSPDWAKCVPKILEHLGRAAGVSRAYIFKNFTAPDEELMTAQQFEWSLDLDLSQAENPECQVHCWHGGGMERWIPLLSQGNVIHSHVKDLPESERDLLAPQAIKSILVVPVMVESNWWGFMGYDECNRERVWSPAEIDALKTAADTLGVAIERGHLEEQRRLLQENLQDALARVLSGYLPICAVCKKIRDEHNHWRFVESYIRDHSELVFSHGICPDCVEKYYANITDLKIKAP
jgi:PAS domain S-box-containing protein